MFETLKTTMFSLSQFEIHERSEVSCSKATFSSLSTALGRDVFQSGRRKGVESSAQERIGDEVIERRSLMKRRKSVGDRTEP